MSADTSTPLDSLCDAFDVAWQGPTPPVLDDYLPAAGAAGREEALFALVRIDLERRTKGRERVRVEDYLRRFPELTAHVENLLALVLLEYDLRRRLEPYMEPAEFLGRFPDLATRLKEQITLVPGAGSAAGPSGEWELDLRDYVLLDCVGRGGMGEVYRGRDPALGRNLAVKVLRPELSGQAAAERRFEREARINGVLQHPSIVPVYNLGRLPDGRLYFTMKLVRGQTLADRLRAGGSGGAWLSDLLNIYEKVCQAVAYAHSRGVIHRDLKPGNIMLGAFGEVQVMDWGVAKVLQRQSAGPPVENTISAITRSTQSGSTAEDEPTGVVGTTPYMAAEQAQGLSEFMDERTDVFGLGAILCAILTGKPPYTGPIDENMLRRAAAGELDEAYSRVKNCGADAELIALCRDCLEVVRDRRPRDAGVVAARVVAYQDAVQERLDKAKQEQAAAHARAEEEARVRRMVEAKAAVERQVRRLTIGVAGLALLLLGAIGLVWWQKQHESQEAEKRELAAKERQVKYLTKMNRQLHTAHDLFDRALKDPRGNPKLLAEALGAFEQAGDLAEASDAPQQLRDEALGMTGAVSRELQAATKDHALLTALLEVHESHKLSGKDEKGKRVPLPMPSVDQQFRWVFREWDSSVILSVPVNGRPAGALDTEQAAARLKSRPPRVVEEASAALDEWASQLRRADRPKDQWLPLAKLADILSDHCLSRPANKRDALRAHRNREEWKKFAKEWDPNGEPVLDTLVVARSLEVVGESERAVELLAKARESHHEEVLLHQALGKLLCEQQKWKEANECFVEAHKQHFELGAALADALVAVGRYEEALEYYKRLLEAQKDNVLLHLRRGNVLVLQERWPEAKAAYKTVYDLRADDAEVVDLLKPVWKK